MFLVGIWDWMSFVWPRNDYSRPGNSSPGNHWTDWFRAKRGIRGYFRAARVRPGSGAGAGAGARGGCIGFGLGRRKG